MASAILKHFKGCIKRKYGLVQLSLEKEEYEFVAAIWCLHQVTLEERYGFLSHFRHSSKALCTPKMNFGWDNHKHPVDENMAINEGKRKHPD